MPTLNTLLDRAAQEGGEKTAFVHGCARLTYSGLRREVLSLAEGLRRAGFSKGDRLAVVHRNSPDFVAAYLAACRLGGTAVPINFMVQKPDELAYMLNDCKAFGVVTQSEFLPGLREAARKCPSVRALWVSDAEEADGPVRPLSALRAPAPAGPAPEDPCVESDTAAILYTSGTTGFPKGVMLTHRNLVTNCEAAIDRIKLGRGDVALCILPMFHSFAWTAIVLLSLRLTLKCVVFSAIAPAAPWLSAMGRHRVTLFAAVPQVYAAIAREAKDTKKRLFLRWWAFRRVKVAVSGAAPLVPAVARAFQEAVGVGIIEGYGLTETSPIATVNPPGDARLGAVGTPVRGVSVKVIDDEEKDLPLGQEGEICVRGDNIMKGYWGQPEATAAAFTKDGWFKTGDVGIVDADGYLAIRDRKKDMIIIKGLKVFSAQVEAVIAEHPAVEEAAVVGVADELGDETIRAFVTLKKGASAAKPELMRFMREKLDAYKRPRDVEILDALPKNALQKVLKRELRERAKAAAPAAPAAA